MEEWAGRIQAGVITLDEKTSIWAKPTGTTTTSGKSRVMSYLYFPLKGGAVARFASPIQGVDPHGAAIRRMEIRGF